MELVEGELLSDALLDGALPTERVLEMAADIARGLTRAHESGIVHRDLKPGNVVLTRDGQPKIIDFGLAKLRERPSDAESKVATAIQGITEPGQVVGTAAYMSPEHAQGADLDARSDIFSFGVVLHELLTGTKPFDGPSAPELLSAIIKEPHAPLPQGSGAPHHKKLQQLIDRCLAKTPEDRFQQMSDVVASLDALRSTGPSAAPTRRARSVTVAAVCIALAHSLGFGSLAARRPTYEGRARRDFPSFKILSTRTTTYVAAFSLALRLDEVLADDPLLDELWMKLAQSISVATEPEGGERLFSALRRSGSGMGTYRRISASARAGSRRPLLAEARKSSVPDD